MSYITTYDERRGVDTVDSTPAKEGRGCTGAL
jgi:hypothetical protein